MKINELIAALEKMPPDAQVKFIQRAYLEGDPSRFVILHEWGVVGEITERKYGNGEADAVLVPVGEIWATT